jgi:hypothetical protein
MSKKTFGTNLVEMQKGDAKSHVVESAFRNVWSKRGWTLVEDEGSKENEPSEEQKPAEPAKLAALKTAQKKEQG